MALIKHVPTDSALGATLEGFIASLKKRLLNENPSNRKAEVVLMQHNDKLTAIRQLQENSERDSQNHITYPFALVSLSDGELSDEAPSSSKMSRTSTGKALVGEGANATMHRLYLYPANVNVEVMVYTDDYLYALELFETHMLQAKRRAYSFPLNFKNVDTWTVDVRASSLSFPKSDERSEQIAGVYELTFTAEIRTKIGITKEVAKINNSGETTQRFSAVGAEEDGIEIETTHNEPPINRRKAAQAALMR